MFLLSVLLLAAPMQDQAPWMIASSPSIPVAREGIKNVLRWAGKHEMAAEMDKKAVTDFFTGKLKGLDLKRPVGVYLLPETAEARVQSYSTILWIPISSEEEFLKFLSQREMPVNENGENRWTISTSKWGTLHLTFQHQYAFISPGPIAVIALPDPKAHLPTSHQEKTMALTLYPERISPTSRSELLNQAKGWLVSGSNDESQGLLRKLRQTLPPLVLAGIVSKYSETSNQIDILATSGSPESPLKLSISTIPKYAAPESTKKLTRSSRKR